MNYYIYMLVTLAVMLVVFKFIFCEIEAYNAKNELLYLYACNTGSNACCI